MKCINPKIGDGLLLYQFGRLSDEEKKSFEAHLLECDCCCQEAYAFGPLVERLKANPQPFLVELAKPASPPRGIGDWLTRIADRFSDFFPEPAKALGWSIVGAMAMAVIVLYLLTRGPGELRDLAQVEPYYFHAIIAMGPAEQTAAEKLFLQGMAHYGKKEYEQALALLERAAALDSASAEFQFYLGVTNLLLRRPQAALMPLQKAVALDSARYGARARWYLGNAYLSLNDVQRALEEFHRVARLEGEYALQARDMTRKIEAFMQNE